MLGAQLQKAIFDALTGGNICAGRIYDQVPAEPIYPYVTIGDEQAIDDGNSCGDSWEVFADLHVWSRSATGSKAELKTIMAALVPLVAVPLVVADHIVVGADLQNTRSFRDPDGLTEHGVVNVRYLIDPA